MNNNFEKMIDYVKAHWQSDLKREWQVKDEDYKNILLKILTDLTKGKTLNKKIVRIAGISGSGKTTQLLPAAEEYFKNKKMSPVLVAAREFAPYHPHFNEIKGFYGEENVRKKTDDFSAIMLFLTLNELVRQGYDIILDVALVDPSMEQILQQLVNTYDYEELILLIAASKEVAIKHLESRGWRHSGAAEGEFIRAMSVALNFYAENFSNLRVIMWDTFSEEPIYDGKVKGALPAFEKASSITEVPPHDEAVLLERKIAYLSML